MIQTLRQIRARTKSIASTMKITRAMEMISASKLSRVKGLFHESRQYLAPLEHIVNHIIASVETPRHPLVRTVATPRHAALCVIASDTGLCGSYNTAVVRYAEHFAQSASHESMRLVLVGKEAVHHFKKSPTPIAATYTGILGRYNPAIIAQVTAAVEKLFTSQEVDEVYVAYTRFSPTLHHLPAVEKLLPFAGAHERAPQYICEPAPDALLDYILPRYLAAKVRSIFLDTLTAEHSARMLAMKTATENAEELIDTLTLIRNKARQAAITKEILEIALSAEALKG